MTDFNAEKQKLSGLATSQQLAAANPNMSVWVEASAGTGKTKVLSDRVLRLLLAKINPSKLLCLTYTKAAAVEMSERIAKHLANWAVESDDDLHKHLCSLLGANYTQEKNKLLNFARTLFATLLDTPGGIKIQTIHSFCQEILKRFPLEAGISPYFEVMDDRQAKEILQNIKLDILKDADTPSYPELGQAIAYLTKNVSEFTFPSILNTITENRNKISTLLKRYKNDLSLMTSALEEKLGVSFTMSPDDFKYAVLSSINFVEFNTVLSIFLQQDATDKKRGENLVKVKESGFSVDVYDLYKSIFLTKDGEIRKKLACAGSVKQYPKILEFMNTEAERIVATEQKIAALNVLHSSIYVLYIAKAIIERYQTYKEVYSVLDYEDLIEITKNLLENKDVADWVLFKLDGGIEHILIDEAQDTSPNQWAIIRALSQEFFAGIGSREDETERTIFVVGDRKQSIYSFQGADPQEFDKMYHYFETQARKFAKICLDVSFRSTKAIMDCVNTLFETEAAKKGVIPENEHINHLPYRLGEGGRVEILPLFCSEEQAKKDKYNWILPVVQEQKTSVATQLAKQIAQNIKNMVESGEILSSKNRPIRYGDFMFLVQRRNSFVESFVRACKDIGVNVAGVDKLKMLEQIAVQDLISLGKFLLLPTDDLSLAEVLKSPLFGLCDDDLFELCHKRHGTVFKSLLQNPKYQTTTEHLKTLLNMVGYTRPFELFTYVLVNLDGRKKFISRMGIEVEDVLDEFLNLTLIFEQSHTPALETFISWIAKDDVIVKKEMEQGENDTVKIMTVHGSKGLQAPIVILADTTRVKNKTHKSTFLWDDELVYFPLASQFYDENCKRIAEKEWDTDGDEYRRLLYVALTRAEDRLYIAGFTNNKEAPVGSWYSLLADALKSNIPLQEGDKRIVYDIAQEIPLGKQTVFQDITSSIPDFSHLLEPAPIEDPLAKPYAPSRDNNDETELVSSPLEDSGNFYKRGTVIHKLLQYVASIPYERREQTSLQFLEKQLPEFSPEERENIVFEVLRLCDTYPQVFSLETMAEVPIIGEAEGKIISAKVDRLSVSGDTVIVVDFKTNRPAVSSLEDIPELYKKQMQTYKLLLEKIYPDKKVETYLLWTNTCNMMKV